MIEIWKDIENYEGLYQVSNLGRIKSLKRTCKHPSGSTRIVNEKIIKLQKPKKTEYLRVCISKKGKNQKLFVHRLVAKAFIPNPNNLPVINHKDENPSNNFVENLEWCDMKYNNNYGTRIKRIQKPIIQVDKNRKIINYFSSTIEAARKTGITRCTITNCLNQKQRTAGGYIWKFVKKEAENV